MRMNTARETETRLLGEIDGAMRRLYEGGAMDEAAMRHYEAACHKEPETFVPDDLKALRERERVSRTDLAYKLGVSPDTVAQWERGQRKPNGPTLKLLSLAKTNGLKHIG